MSVSLWLTTSGDTVSSLSHKDLHTWQIIIDKSSMWFSGLDPCIRMAIMHDGNSYLPDTRRMFWLFPFIGPISESGHRPTMDSKEIRLINSPYSLLVLYHACFLSPIPWGIEKLEGYYDGFTKDVYQRTRNNAHIFKQEVMIKCLPRGPKWV